MLIDGFGALIRLFIGNKDDSGSSSSSRQRPRIEFIDKEGKKPEGK